MQTTARRIAPIRFPDQPAAARPHLDAEATRFGERMRMSQAVTAASANAQEAGYRLGYVDGTHHGMWSGGLVGFVCGGVCTVALYALRAWSATL